ncbi:MAG: hypothetical protein IJM88_03115 [Bacteroidales bacterium]|nr:hypothetical protein [Bacteroidales bacterium]
MTGCDITRIEVRANRPALGVLLLAAALLLAGPACAGWKQVTLQGLGGLSWDSGDLFFESPVAAWSGALMVEYGFRRRAYVPQHVSAMVGLGALRSGSRYEMTFPYADAERSGSYGKVALTLPVRVAYNHPVPLGEERLAMLSLWVGTTVCVGLSGHIQDKMTSGRYADEAVNYEHSYGGAEFFDHVRRCDVALDWGVSYCWGRWSLSLLWEMGLLPQRLRAEAMPFVDVVPPLPHVGRYGQRRALLLGVGYHWAVRGKIHHSHQRGSVFM